MSEKLEALGQPVEEPSPEGEHDFAGEHDATVVDKDVLDGDADGESESPRGWSGMDHDDTA
ncbi:hypothetical protein [Spirilliplanes yamanashiensis]|uniref:Uncharacterized protein n=1 Tax=Spirilliplanes yamanashiensis TaxID=42233 RepID=A0A8J3YDT5_9ACTN|nr:hypothetical protein [Spirilliplanes yamanashiensis]MDP9816346.1 hypothetical protein [Spirilliplanes yamanashiensis]GIJ05873.1 hypothetical protein Sya03_52250 [Spirilliplanes yamanashiensis]